MQQIQVTAIYSWLRSTLAGDNVCTYSYSTFSGRILFYLGGYRSMAESERAEYDSRTPEEKTEWLRSKGVFIETVEERAAKAEQAPFAAHLNCGYEYMSQVRRPSRLASQSVLGAFSEPSRRHAELLERCAGALRPGELRLAPPLALVAGCAFTPRRWGQAARCSSTCTMRATGAKTRLYGCLA